MRIAIALGVLGVCVLSFPVAAKPAAARRCADFSQRLERQNKAVYFILRNRCEEAVTCKLKWNTRCNKGEPSPHEDEATVKGKESHEFYAPTSCTEEESWEVTGATWSCG